MSSLCCEDEGNSNPVNNLPIPISFSASSVLVLVSKSRRGCRGCSLKELRGLVDYVHLVIQFIVGEDRMDFMRQNMIIYLWVEIITWKMIIHRE